MPELTTTPTILDVQNKAFLYMAGAYNLKSLPLIEERSESIITKFKNDILLKPVFVHYFLH